MVQDVGLPGLLTVTGKTFLVCVSSLCHSARDAWIELNSPNVCPDQPCGNSVFCEEHLKLAGKRGYPTTVKEFLHFCGAQKTLVYNCYMYKTGRFTCRAL